MHAFLEWVIFNLILIFWENQLYKDRPCLEIKSWRNKMFYFSLLFAPISFFPIMNFILSIRLYCEATKVSLRTCILPHSVGMVFTNDIYFILFKNHLIVKTTMRGGPFREFPPYYAKTKPIVWNPMEKYLRLCSLETVCKWYVFCWLP